MKTFFVRFAQVVVVGLVIFGGYLAYHEQPRPGTALQAPVSLDLGSKPVIGPFGLGKLRVGMTEAEANATGQVRINSGWQGTTNSDCEVLKAADGGSIQFSRDHGLAVISAPKGTRTPQGIQVGSSLDDVAAAYPALTKPDLGNAYEQVGTAGYVAAPVPGNPEAIYVFVFHAPGRSVNGPLQSLLIALRDQDYECTPAS